MALIKNVALQESPSVLVSYWRIVEVLWSGPNGIKVQLAGHATESDRRILGDRSDGPALGRITVDLPPSEDIGTIESLYRALKKTDAWASAQDA